ncbi:hypothetical protein V1504DRAFT_464062 [Lipomyces starkeyi]
MSTCIVCPPLRVHLFLVTGDQPAIAKLMCLKGDKGPCRFCLVEGVVAPNKQNYYLPVH